MKALILEAPGRLSVADAPIPALEPGDLLIRVEAATTCGTDLKAYRRGHPQIPMPGPFGHEYTGKVVATGVGAKFSVGTAVMGVHSAPCQACFWCTVGQENLCETIMETKVLGAYAEYLRIPARIANLNVYERPADLAPELASLLEPLACVMQGVLLLPGIERERVLIIGPGAIGLMFASVLHKMGSDVTICGKTVGRLAVGEALGVRAVQTSEIQVGPIGFDTVIECTGMPEVWEKSVDAARRGGRVMLFGGCPSGTSVSFETYRLHYDQVSLISPFHFGTEAVREAHRLLAVERLDLSPLISGSAQLEEAEEVFGDLEARKGIKYAFRP
jgi:L-iditol 2-dehydrogenase